MKWPYLTSGVILPLAVFAGCSQDHKSTNPIAAPQAAFQAHCNDVIQPEYNRWLGCPVEMLSSQWGAPDRQMNLPGGSIVLVWEKKEIPPWKGIALAPPPAVTCEVSVTVNATGTIMGLASRTIALFPAQPLQCEIDSETGPIFSDRHP